MRAPLIIGGKEVSIAAMLDFSQQIEPVAGRVSRRFSNGDLFVFSRWQKQQVTLSASGWVPAALWAVNYSAPFLVELPLPVVLSAGESLPPGFTSRSAPFGEVENVDAAGAAGRLVWVKFMASSIGPTSTSSHGRKHSWQLVLEQV